MFERNGQLLQTHQAEFKFFRAGGYGRPFRSQWRPTLLFRDSAICPDFTAPEVLNPCQQCPLFALVPSDKRDDAIPCHHIVLDTEGHTIAQLYQTGSQQVLDQRFSDWLAKVIAGLERPRKAA